MKMVRLLIGIAGLILLAWGYVHFESLLKEHWLSRNLKEIELHTLPDERPVGRALCRAIHDPKRARACMYE